MRSASLRSCAPLFALLTSSPALASNVAMAFKTENGYCISSPNYAPWLLLSGIAALMLAALAAVKWKKWNKPRRRVFTLAALLCALTLAAVIYLSLTDRESHQVQCPPFAAK